MIILLAPVSPSGGRVPNGGEFVEAVCPCLTIIQNPTVPQRDIRIKLILMQTERRSHTVTAAACTSTSKIAARPHHRSAASRCRCSSRCFRNSATSRSVISSCSTALMQYAKTPTTKEPARKVPATFRLDCAFAAAARAASAAGGSGISSLRVRHCQAFRKEAASDGDRALV